MYIDDKFEIKNCFRLASENNLKLFIAYQKRFDYDYMGIYNFIKNDDPKTIRMVTKDHPIPPIEYLKTSNGIVEDMMSHDIDMVNLYMDFQVPEKVIAFSYTHLQQLLEIDEIEGIEIMMQYKDGQIVTLNGSRNAYYGYDQRAEIFCCNNLYSLKNRQDNNIECFNNANISLSKIKKSFPERYINSYKSELEEFYNMVKHNKPIVITEEHILLNKKICNAINTSLKTKQIVYNEVSKLTDTIEGFKQIDDIVEFIDQYSEVPYDTVYKPRGRFNNEYADILFGLEKGEVFGPYRDNNDFKLSKLIDIKRNASIRASHILISYNGATRANSNVSRTEKEAKSLANRVYREARRSSSDFRELAMKYSDGPTKNSGGDLGFFQQGQMAEEFFTFANTNRVGKLGIVKTEFGYHIIKITDKDDLALIADVVIKAVPSDKTSNEVFRKATQFEMESKNDKDFAKIAQNNNYKIRTVSQISELEENLPGLPKQRNIVRWTFEEDSSIGDVKRFTLNSGGYVVVQITEKIDKGLSSIDNVGEEVRKIISKKKKEVIIKNRYKDIQRLDSFSKEDKVVIETASAINQKNPTIPGTGNEPFVVGAAFALTEGKTSSLITGEKGVYMIVLLKKNIVPDLDDYYSYSKLILKNSSQNLAENIFNALKSVANIEDNRALYY